MEFDEGGIRRLLAGFIGVCFRFVKELVCKLFRKYEKVILVITSSCSIKFQVNPTCKVFRSFFFRRSYP